MTLSEEKQDAVDWFRETVADSTDPKGLCYFLIGMAIAQLRVNELDDPETMHSIFSLVADALTPPK